MMAWEMKDGIHNVGAVDWDRRLFDELIPLPDGTSYNAYLVRGSEKTALIDTVDPTKEDELFENLERTGVDRLDYVIPNHAEQDHSGTIPKVLERYPEAKVVTNGKCKEFLIDLLHIQDDKFQVVEDGETLSLGDRTLEFIIAPWVHWPETMLTYLREDRILFSCDLFGSHLATSDKYVKDESKVLEDAKRYYAEIMMPFRKLINGHLEKLRGYDIEVIAASHGPLYDRPESIMEAYRDWTSDDVKNEVVIAYVSMHGSTERMVERFANTLIERGIRVRPFNLAGSDVGELAMALVDAATLVVGTPTVLAGPHPAAVYAAYLANALRPKTRYATVIGSYGWGGRTVDQVKSMLQNLSVEFLEPVIVKGLPRADDMRELDRLADSILKKHQEHNIIGE
ncbi:MAG: MBL fold metallo-hydrolase [Candidatus Altiarchaeales archaeon]|nr:MBL fold metallo-hydrolase [Candidatus Altiarchaeales archaeon]MBD3416391.1 MBL fold metallo-hydrolase [Candidatus Altiarchaeales archaeon]